MCILATAPSNQGRHSAEPVAPPPTSPLMALLIDVAARAQALFPRCLPPVAAVVASILCICPIHQELPPGVVGSDIGSGWPTNNR